MKRHALKVGEYYAIKANAIERDADGFFILVGDSTPENEPRGSVVVVHVRGALCQFKGDGGDSYEAIVERVAAAFAADPKPSSVMLCISSPGGIVAGLNECVFKLQRMSDDAKIPLVAFVNELAASAAMAIACAASKRFGPPSLIAGSIGTISTMVSCVGADKKDGLDFRIITSGKRKSDGHPHVEISTDAERAERARNAELAEQFFSLAAKALGVSPRKLEALEAAIFVGDAARKVGLIDKVMSLDAALAGLDRTESAPPATVAPNEGNITDRRAKELDKGSATGSLSPQEGVTNNVRHGVMSMKAKVQALITKTEAAIAVETDPAQLRILEAKLGTFLARAEMDDDDGDDEPKKKKDSDDDDGGDEESKSEKAAKKAEADKKAAKAAGHRARASEFKKKAAEAEEEAQKCEAEDEEEASKKGEDAKATLSDGALAAVTSSAALVPEAMRRIEKLEKDAGERQRKAMVDGARAERKITPAEYKALIGKPIAFVKDFLAMRPNAIVNVDDEALEIPDVSTVAGDVPASVKSMVESAVQSLGLKGEKAEQHREKQYAAFRAGTAGRAVTH